LAIPFFFSPTGLDGFSSDLSALFGAEFLHSTGSALLATLPTQGYRMGVFLCHTTTVPKRF
jgi:hypothetical protein